MALTPVQRLILFAPRYDADAKVAFAAMQVLPTAARMRLYSDFIKNLKDAGVWTKLDFIYLFAAHDAQAARLNLKSPGTFNATAVNSPTFTADQGYAGNGTTSYLSSGFALTQAGAQFAQNSQHIGVWSRTNTAVDNAALMGAGASNESVRTVIFPRDASDIATYALAHASSTAANADSSGHFVARRSSSGAVALFRNGVSLGTDTDASAAQVGQAIYIGARNDGGTPNNFTSRQIASSHAGANLTDQNIIDAYAAELTWIQGVGAA